MPLGGEGEGDLGVQGGGGRAEPPDLLHTEDGGETVCDVRAHEREGVPVAREDVRREAAEATGAEAQGSWGEAVDVFPVQEGVLKRLCGEQVGRCALALSEQASCPDSGVCHGVEVRPSCVDAAGSCARSLRALTRCPCAKEDIVEEMDGRGEREHITAASAAYLNKGMEPTASSLHCCLAATSGGA
jgi:hypothetical protein